MRFIRDAKKADKMWDLSRRGQNLREKALETNCPACLARRVHSESEWLEYHPKAGTGINNDDGPPVGKKPS
jgi:hypothetical protein